MSTLDRLAAALADRYAVERELGAGGMATVYLATDVRHRRKVAMKVLRPELAATMGPDRFLREIEIAAQLQHPHILPLLDSGEADGFLFYVMPYVQGESLRERLAREHELPVHDAIRIVTEVADALTHAHGHGVVHRDIKPENIMLSGRHALVTDFGVAKAVSEASGRLRLTSVGVALGTPTYMAPEQASADPELDHRVDIYALGVVAYELLAGRPPFSGRTAQEVLAAHMTRAPEPIRNYRGSVSPALDATVLRCLEKHPADRWQTTTELLAQLEPLATPSGGITPTDTRPVTAVPVSRPPRGVPRWLAWAGAGALVAAGALALSRWQSPEPAIVIGRRTAVAVAPAWERWPSFTPDGKTIVFSRGSIGDVRLYVQQIGGGAPIPVATGLDGWQCCAAVSPDGSRILFLTARGLYIVPTLGGQPRLVRGGVGQEPGRPVPPVLWGSWSPSGAEIAYTDSDTLFVQAAEGGARRAVIHTNDAHSPVWSPDGRWIAFVRGNPLFHRNGNLAPASVMLVPAEGGSPIAVTDTTSFNTNPLWIPGRSALLYISDRDGGRDLYEQRLSGSGRPAGPPVRLTTGLAPDRVALSADGTRLAWSVLTETTGIWSLRIPERDSVSLSMATPLLSGAETIEVVTASPDGRWIYYDSDIRGSSDIWRVAITADGRTAGAPQQVTSDPAPEFSPSVSPDGSETVFHSFRSGNRDLFIVPSSGGTAMQITSSAEHDWNPGWSPDGRRIVFDRQTATDSSLWIVERDPGGRWSEPAALPFGDGALLPRWSPDGREIAFASDTGIMILDLASRRLRLAGFEPRRPVWTAWSPNGDQVYAAGLDLAGRPKVWAFPASGAGPVRTVVYSDEGDLHTHRHGLTIAGGRFYLALIERKSDVWVAEVTRP